MAGLPQKEDSSGDEQIRLDPYYVFDRHFREKDGKGAGKGKGRRG